MADELELFVAAAHEPALAALIGDTRPVLAFDRSGTGLVWANAAGAAYFNVHSPAELLSRRFSPAHPAVRRIASLAVSLGSGDERVERIALPRGLVPKPVVCKASRLQIGANRSVLLLVADGSGQIAGDPVAAYAAFCGAPAAVAAAEPTSVPTPVKVAAVQSAPVPPAPVPSTPVQDLLPSGDEVLAVTAHSEDEIAFAAEPDLPADDDVEVIVAPPIVIPPLAPVASAADPVPADAEDLPVPSEVAEDLALVPVAADDAPLDVAEAEDVSPELAEDAPLGVADAQDVVPAEAQDAPAVVADVPAEELLSETTGVADLPVAEPAPSDTLTEVSAVESEPSDTPDALPAQAELALAPVEPEAVADAAPAPTEAEPQPIVEPAVPAFVFPDHGRPVRFVFELDSTLAFSFLSSDFAATVGPLAGDLAGTAWSAVAARFTLDPRNRVSQALERRDTFTGLTVDWPVQGAEMRVPIDLAGMPVFGRDRRFSGYRGFGVIKTGAAFSAPLLVAATDALPVGPEAEGNAEPEVEPTVAVAALAVTPSIAAAVETPAAEIAAPIEAEAPSAETADVGSPAEPVAPATAGKATPAAIAAEAATIAGPVEVSDVTPASRDAGPAVEAVAIEVSPSVEEIPAVNEPVAPAGDDAAVLVASAAEAVPIAEPVEGTEVSDVAPASEHAVPAAESVVIEDSPSVEEIPAPIEVDEPVLPALAASADLFSEPPAAPDEPAFGPTTDDSAQDATDPLPGFDPDAPVPTEEPLALAASEDVLTQAPDAQVLDTAEASDVPSAVEAVTVDAPTAEAVTLASGEGEVRLGDEPSAAETPLAEVASEVVPSDTAGPDGASEDQLPPASETFLVGYAEPIVIGPLDDLAAVLGSEDSTRSISDHLDEIEHLIAVEETLTAAREQDIAWSAPEQSSGEVIPVPIVPRPIPREDAGRLSKTDRETFDRIAEALSEAFGARGEKIVPTPTERLVAPVAVKSADVPVAAPVPAPVAPVQAAVELPAALDFNLIDKLPLALAVLKHGEIVHANRAFLDLAAYANLEEMNAAGGFASVFEGSALPRESTIPAIRRKDGVEVPVTARLHSIPFGTSVASMLVVQETSQTTSRERLQLAEQRVEDLEGILDTATDGVLVLDQKGIVIGANRSAEALFGLERSHMVGLSFIDLLAPESHRGALDYLDGLTRNGLSSVLNDGREVIGKVASGGLVPLFMTIGRVSLTKFCAVLRDITQWKRAEEELTSAKKAAENASSQKSDFLAKMSHEIRTPLNAIIGFSEVMMEERFGPVGSDRYKEYLRDIHMSGSHIMSLVNDLLDLSKIEAGKLELSFEAVGINEVIRECAALMQPQANRERIIIRTSLSSSLPPVVADSRSLRQIVLNLLSNAVKFNTAGGQVIVSTLYEESGEVVLRVRDTGHGMSEGDIEKALEPFRQLQTTRTGQGTGLGLPLTKALVEANRAAFRIDSTPGQGTLVQITFPSTRVLAE